MTSTRKSLFITFIALLSFSFVVTAIPQPASAFIPVIGVGKRQYDKSKRKKRIYRVSLITVKNAEKLQEFNTKIRPHYKKHEVGVERTILSKKFAQILSNAFITSKEVIQNDIFERFWSPFERNSFGVCVAGVVGEGVGDLSDRFENPLKKTLKSV